MSVVGFDFGNLQSVIAVARNRGIDIICNEVSNRFTPSLVSFGAKSRQIGESASTMQISNLKNTIGSLKRLVGRPASDPTLAKEQPFLVTKLETSPASPSGETGVTVNYLGEDKTFSATQIAAMYLSKLKQITEHETNTPVSDVVVSVPLWFAPAQRKAMMEACEIAGLNPLRIINDTTAAALAYGITKTDLPEEEPRKVVFVDIGHSSTQIAAVSFVKGKLVVKATGYDAFMGGRDLDQLLVNHFVNEFKEKYKFDLSQFPKPLFRLRAAIEKLKKVLSANSQAPLNIEALHEDRDVSSMISREEFEVYAQPFISRIAPLLQQVLDKAGWKADEVFCVETIGGTTRVPAVRDAIIKFFGRDLLSFTINQDEAVSRGCALMCAIISPAFRVRDFDIKDVAGYNVKVNWQQPLPEGGETAKELSVFETGGVVPATKVLTFYRSADTPFDFEAELDGKASPPATGAPSFLGRYTIKRIPLPAKDATAAEPTTVKVRVRMNPNHMVQVEAAHALVEDDSPPPPAPEPAAAEGEAKPAAEGADKAKDGEKSPTSPEDASSPASAADEPPKKKFKKFELSVIHGEQGLPTTVVQKLREEEGQMAATDRLVFDTEVAKNSLEEYIYEARGKKDVEWADFITEEDKDKLSTLLNAAEDWLYSEEGEDATKSVYVGKLGELKAIGAPAAERVREHADRPRAAETLYTALRMHLARLDDEQFAWLPEAERTAAKEKLAAKKKWADETLGAQVKMAKHASPLAVTCAQLYREKEEADRIALPLLNRPKPAPKPEEKPAEEAKPEGGEAAATPSGAEKPADEKKAAGGDDMNVD